MDSEKEKETQEFYERLKKELDLSTAWPALYLYKFIVPTDKENILYKNKAYFAVTESGKMFEGTTDSEGYTTPIYTEEQENINFHLIDNLEKNIEDEQWENPSQD